jgi:hypothetical protein
MPKPLIPPRGVFAPASIAYNANIPPVTRDTYVQLFGLAYGDTETPPLSFNQLNEITGKGTSTLRGHLTFLRDQGVLRWRTAQDGTIIVSFPKGASKGQAFFDDQPDDSGFQEKHDEEEDINFGDKSVLPPPHPLDSQLAISKNENAQSQVQLREDVQQALLDAGVFKSKLHGIQLAGLTNDEILAIVRWVNDEFRGERKAGLLIYRIENQILSPKQYFSNPCSECGNFGAHDEHCSMGRRSKYICPDCSTYPCSCDEDDED